MSRNVISILFCLTHTLLSCRNEPSIIPSLESASIQWISPQNGDSLIAPFTLHFTTEGDISRPLELYVDEMPLMNNEWFEDSVLVLEAPEGLSKWVLKDASMELQSEEIEILILKNSFQLEVIRGTGSGFYKRNQLIDIVAESFIGLVFSEWRGDFQYLKNESLKSTSLSMPAKNLKIEAGYSIEDTVYFFRDIQPIFQASCAIPDCHDTGEYRSNLTDTTEIRFNAQAIKDNVASGFMPTRGEISAEERYKIIAWVNQGYKIN